MKIITDQAGFSRMAPTMAQTHSKDAYIRDAHTGGDILRMEKAQCALHGEYVSYQYQDPTSGEYSHTGCKQCWDERMQRIEKVSNWLSVRKKQREEKQREAQREQERKAMPERKKRRAALRGELKKLDTTNLPSKKAQCALHGEFVQYKIPLTPVWSGCSKCAEKEHQQEQAAHNQQRIADKVSMMKVPARYKEKNLHNWHTQTTAQTTTLKRANRFIQNWHQNKSQSIVMLGNVGTGKTHLAIAIGKSLIEKYDATVRYGSVLGFVNEIKASWDRDAHMSEAQVMHSYDSPQLLILDEVGVQFGSQTEKVKLIELLNKRYERMQATILISNISKHELKNYLDERIIDRLSEDKTMQWSFNWSSWRKK